MVFPESTSVGIFSPVLGLKKVGSIGIPIPDNDVRLVDVENGERMSLMVSRVNHHEGTGDHAGLLEQSRRDGGTAQRRLAL